MKNIIIELKSIVKNYKKSENNALNNVSFKINDNEICLFCGPNGAGKTTTIKTIFKELNINEGEILLNNKTLTNSDLKLFSFYPDSNNISLSLTIKEYLEYIGTIHKLTKTQIKEKQKFLKTFFNLEEHFNKKLKDLSAGWKKRAIFAGVLVNEPKYVFMDEPTANLDIATKDYFIKLIELLNKKNVTFFITTHQIEDFISLNNHLIIINKGKILFDDFINPTTQDSKKIYLEHIKEETSNFEMVDEIYKNQ